MCLIIQADKPQKITDTMVNCAYQNNSDGFGLMFYAEDKIQVRKMGQPKSFQHLQKLWSSFKNVDVPMGLHFRFATNGATTKSNSHPYQILSKQNGDDRNMWLMHNGPQLPTPMIDDDKSDTHQFIKWILKPQLINNPDLLENHEWQDMLSEQIGTDKLLFLDDKSREFTIINAEQGKQNDDMWLSNTYSLEPTGGYAVSRDYKYDFDTDTMVKNDPMKYYYDDDEWYGHYSGVSSHRQLHNYNSPSELHNPKKDGTQLTADDFVAKEYDDVADIVENNPQGTANWIHDICNGNDGLVELCSVKDEHDEYMEDQVNAIKGGK